MSKVVKTVAAAAIGFAAGILLAPKSGKETREDIKVKADEAKAKARTKADQAKEAAMEAKKHLAAGTKKVQTEARGMAHSAQKSAGVISEQAEALKDEARERAGRVAETSRTTAAHVKSDADKHLR